LSRSRYRNTGNCSATGTWGGTPQTWSNNTRDEECHDVIGDYGGNHQFLLERREYSGSQLMYKTAYPLVVNSPGAPTAFYNVKFDPAIAGEESLASLVNRVLATTGPLTPRVNLPLALFELKDVPQMLRHAGNLLHGLRSPSRLNKVKEAAAANLAYKFGWAPIIDDLGKLFDFSAAVRRKQRELKQANSSNGLRRRINLGTRTDTTVTTEQLWSTYGLLLSIGVRGTRTSRTWAVVHWRARNPDAYGGNPTWLDAARTALGGNLGMIPISVWKAMPWTWMIDWFADISNIMLANYNSIYYKPYRLSIMRHSTGTFTHREYPLGNPESLVTAGLCQAEKKERYANNAPSASFSLRAPFLDAYKMSVLGSLAILKDKNLRAI
jgi:hypothetical protein